MKNEVFSEAARWIWSRLASRPYNNYVSFRHDIDVNGPNATGRLRITADSRYEVWVNGKWLGHGPPRGWVSPWMVDEYDLRGKLVNGKNIVAVLVHHIGVSTFQYLHAEPGLLAQIDYDDARGSHTIVTDGSWKAQPHEGYAARVPRISVQQAWEEQFDAQVERDGNCWLNENFDDSGWPSVSVERKPGEGVHAAFELRDIPMLSREIVEPTRVVAIDAVQPARYSFSINLREAFNPDDRSANMMNGRTLVATFIHSDRAQDIELHYPHYAHTSPTKLNGKLLKFDDASLQLTGDGVAHGKLKKGWNVLMINLSTVSHAMAVIFNAWTDSPITLSSEQGQRSGQPWLSIGPFAADAVATAWALPPFIQPSVHPAATAERYEDIWKRAELSNEDLAAPFTRKVAEHMIAPVDVYAICASERRVTGGKTTVNVENPAAVQRDNSDWTTIHPTPGADVRILFDFGLTVVGYHEFELDAPAGAVVDNHNFEFIQRDGRINLAEGMNNSFRYTCREGTQRYRTFVRRGFRYSWFSFRNFDRPIRVRFVRVLLSTNPPAGQGSFECSDKLLDGIWQVGAHSVRCCSEDTYTDCPSYEQTHWVGDARNEALVDLITNGDPRLSRHAWIQAGRSLDRSPIVESHVPSGWENVLPAWSFLWMRWAHEHYLLTGDKAFAREAMPMLERNIDGIEKYITKDGLFQLPFSWSLFDWAAMDCPNDGVVTHLSCLAVLGLRQAAELATLLSQGAKAKKWNKIADGMAKAVNKILWDNKKKAYIDSIHADGKRSKVFSQQTATAAYISGVANGARGTRCRQIVENPPNGFVKAGSPFFMFFALEGLVREGRWNELVSTIRSYWGAQVQAGATTYWEEYHPERPRTTRSHCHGWSAAPTFFLSQYILGVYPLEPGYSKVRIAPQSGGLEWAQGTIPTPRGVVSVYWRREGNTFALNVDVPPGTPMQIEIPWTGKMKVVAGKVSGVKRSKGSTTLQSRGDGPIRLQLVK